ncbi:probable serine/threonine-protein kinase WNK5 [Chenopodium quinoa]|uniref:probable serine/threonine-protein kinase WNK5 n=1 Tax=Chenopodium quinoa TaxID=63459 RepID=UPI000B787D16|nr:probable serine/threonine-protein kinase WNK5 [Chenopodium quinoa]
MAASSSQANDYTVMETDQTRRFARYKLLIGEGSSKKVYRGFDRRYGTEIAWSKVRLPPGKEASMENLEELCAEPELLRSLDHENITKCYHYWIDYSQKVVNMITEYCSSGNLTDYSREHVHNLVGNAAIKNWCRQILSALHYLHTHNPPITHRDVKCSNIFVKGNTSTIKLGDLGMAKIFESGSSPAFRTDIFLFGNSITQMVTKEVQITELSSYNDLVDIGFKPVGLLGVTDPQMKQLIDKCVDFAADGPTAMDLLNDPLLAVDVTETSTASTSSAPGNLNLREIVQDQVAGLLLPPTEVLREFDSGDKKFRLQGIMSEDVSISITLRIIIDGNDLVSTISFDFLLGVDTISDIMVNIQGNIDSSAEVIAIVSENMEHFITEFPYEPYDSNTPSIVALEDWCLQDLFSEETSSGDAPRTHEKSNYAPPNAHDRPNDAPPSAHERPNNAQDQTSTSSNRRQHNEDAEQQQSPRGRSEDNRRRGNWKLPLCSWCAKF